MQALLQSFGKSSDSCATGAEALHLVRLRARQHKSNSLMYKLIIFCNESRGDSLSAVAGFEIDEGEPDYITEIREMIQAEVLSIGREGQSPVQPYIC